MHETIRFFFFVASLELARSSFFLRFFLLGTFHKPFCSRSVIDAVFEWF